MELVVEQMSVLWFFKSFLVFQPQTASQGCSELWFILFYVVLFFEHKQVWSDNEILQWWIFSSAIQS